MQPVCKSAAVGGEGVGERGRRGEGEGYGWKAMDGEGVARRDRNFIF